MNRIKDNEYFFALVNKVLTVGLSFVFSILSTRYFGSEIKGLTSYILSVVAIVSTILTLGIHHAYAHFRNNSGDCDFVKKYVSFVICLYSVLLICALCISLHFRNDLIIFGSILISPLYSYTRVIGYVLLVEEPNRRNLLVTISAAVEVIFALVLFMSAPRNILLALLLTICMNVFQAICFTIWALKRIGFTFGFGFELTKSSIFYGFFPMIALLLTNLNYRVDVLMLKSFSFITLSEIGVYSLGIQLSEQSALVTDTFQEILLAHLAKKKKETEVAQIIRLCIPISIIIALIIVSIGYPILPLLYGKEFSKAYIVIMICVVGNIMMTVFKMVSQYNIIISKQKLNALMLGISIIVNIIMNSFMIPLFGINGAAISTLVGSAVCSAVFLIYFSNISNIGIHEIIVMNRKDVAKIKELFHKDEGIQI